MITSTKFSIIVIAISIFSFPIHLLRWITWCLITHNKYKFQSNVVYFRTHVLQVSFRTRNKCEHVSKNNKQEIDIFFCVYCTYYIVISHTIFNVWWHVYYIFNYSYYNFFCTYFNFFPMYAFDMNYMFGAMNCFVTSPKNIWPSL